MTLPSIDYQTYIQASPRIVFEVLTSAAGWDTWFTQSTELDARPGGSIRLRWLNCWLNWAP